MDALSDMLSSGRDKEAQQSKIYGLVIGLVTDNKDPDKLGRIKVKFPWLADDVVSHWARIVFPMGGQTKDGTQFGGFWFIPQVDDEVLVGFQHGDVHFPYIIGGLYNGVDKPPKIDDITSTFAGEGYDHGAYSGSGRDFNEDGKNDLRFIRSRSGHLFIFDDKDGDERISLCDKEGKRRIEISTKKKHVVITSADTDGSIELIAEDKILLRCKRLYTESREETDMKAGKTFKAVSKEDMTHKSDKNFVREAGMNIDEKSGQNSTYKAGMAITCKGGMSGTLEGGTDVTVKGGASGTVDGGGSLTVKGGMVNIN
jgi:uncharacterized protein involved in type VI secretion and phage assembly